MNPKLRSSARLSHLIPALLLAGLSQASAAGLAGIIAQDEFEDRLPTGLTQGQIIEWSDLYLQPFPNPFNSQKLVSIDRGTVVSLRFTTPASFTTGNVSLNYFQTDNGSTVVSISKVPGDFSASTVPAECQKLSPAITITLADAPMPSSCVLDANSEYYFNLHVGSDSVPDGSGASCPTSSCAVVGGALAN